MGNDFTSHQMFTADNPKQRRVQLTTALQTYLLERGFVEVIKPHDADRSIAIGPVGRWLCVYDSYGNGDNPDREEFEDLALHLSQVAPVVDIRMDDSAAVHLLLYRGGETLDRFADSAGVINIWPSEAERDKHRGRPELWAGFLVEPGQIEALRQAWRLSSSDALLSRTAALMGWHSLLCKAGYTIDYDGCPVYYKDHLEGEPVDTSEFIEHCYSRAF